MADDVLPVRRPGFRMTRDDLRLRAIAAGGLLGYFAAAAFGDVASLGFVVRYGIAWVVTSGLVYWIGLRFLKDS